MINQARYCQTKWPGMPWRPAGDGANKVVVLGFVILGAVLLDKARRRQ